MQWNVRHTWNSIVPSLGMRKSILFSCHRRFTWFYIVFDVIRVCMRVWVFGPFSVDAQTTGTIQLYVQFSTVHIKMLGISWRSANERTHFTRPILFFFHHFKSYQSVPIKKCFHFQFISHRMEIDFDLLHNAKWFRKSIEKKYWKNVGTMLFLAVFFFVIFID